MLHKRPEQLFHLRAVAVQVRKRRSHRRQAARRTLIRLLARDKFRVDKEAVLSRDPDVILIGAAGEDAVRQVREWNKYASLRAVQRHHVFIVDPTLTGRMSPRILQGVRQVCSFLDQSRSDRAGTG